MKRTISWAKEKRGIKKMRFFLKKSHFGNNLQLPENITHLRNMPFLHVELCQGLQFLHEHWLLIQ